MSEEDVNDRWAQGNQTGKKKNNVKCLTHQSLYLMNLYTVSRLFKFIMLFSVIAAFSGEQNYAVIVT